MLQLPDIRDTRVYKDAVEEGMKKGLEKAIAIARLAAEKKSLAEIAATLEVDVEIVRQVLAQPDRS